MPPRSHFGHPCPRATSPKLGDMERTDAIRRWLRPAVRTSSSKLGDLEWVNAIRRWLRPATGSTPPKLGDLEWTDAFSFRIRTGSGTALPWLAYLERANALSLRFCPKKCLFQSGWPRTQMHPVNQHWIKRSSNLKILPNSKHDN